MKKGRSPNRVLQQTNTDHLDELISWARWLDSKVDVAHPTKEMAKKTCKLFSPNARVKFLALFARQSSRYALQVGTFIT